MKSRGGLHIKMGKRKLMNGKKIMSLSKSRRWHGFNEKEEFCCQNNCWGQRLPLLKGSVLRATGWCWEWAHFGPASWQRGTQVPAEPRARASSLPGSGAGWLLGWSCSGSGPHAQLCFLGCVGETVTRSSCVISPAYGLAV